MTTRLLLTAAAALVLSACGSRGVDIYSGGEVAATTPVSASTLPAGSAMSVRLDNALSTRSSKVGDRFSATVTQNVLATNGAVVVPAGAVVQGRVTQVRTSDDITQRAYLQLQFESLSFNNRTYPFDASVQNVATVQERNPSTGEILQRAGVGAAAGAVLGAIVSGAELDAIIRGGLLGAAAGTVIGMGMGGAEHVIPAGTVIELRSTQTVSIQ